jgi:putative DNA primase/helicase
MIKAFLKPENYSALALEELGQRFKTAELFGKLANLGDDISNKYLEDTAIFKKLSTGDTVNAERKGKDPFEFESYAKLVFSANDIPRINDLTDGLKRRLVIIPFNAKFSDTDANFDPNITDKLQTDRAMRYLLKVGLEGLKRVLAANKFTRPEVVKHAMVQYESINNPVLAFIEEGHKIENELSMDVYLRYNTWCHENGLKPLSHIVFSREVCKHGFRTKAKKIEGKTYQIFEVVKVR